jgi:hypothetical protein
MTETLLPFLGHLDPFGPHIEIPKIRLYLKSGMEETETERFVRKFL